MKKFVLVAALVSGSMMLQGCVAALVGVGAGTAKVATDPRTTGTQVDDTTLDSKIGMKFKDEGDYFKGSRIVPSTYDGNVLLIGQAKSQAVINRAVELAESVEGVKKIYNQVRIGPMVNAITMTNDAWITTKVKSALIGNNDTKARDIKVITEDGEVFLIGIVTPEIGRTASDVASKVASVKLVTTIYTYSN
ncbi:osmotically-inducible protein OsmY [Orbus hercynius]|uniref:Osmotically-inducible protein OsmY n=1 Tax=Orbus hercynius TaxID=593135 RepID=A0A495RHB0_9GAMM|nr:division/outer membrane stress-associated lipid-binding lipoprotein [Orbus hercynius]RKS86811.1 osmotically-inducible protein OsmY [Orbus hercynius]